MPDITVTISNTEQKCLQYDIADDLSWKSKKNFVLQHSAERVKIYDKERFDYREYEIQIS